MEPEAPQEKSLDEILEQVDLQKLGIADKTELRLPARMELVRRDSEIEIARKWLSRETAFVIAIVIVGSWVAAPFVIKELVEELVPKGAEAWQIIAGSLAGALVVTYCAIAGCLNRTHIVASREKITVRHGPIPWVGYNQMGVSNLKQFYTKELVSGKGGTHVTYEVYAITSDDRDRHLVGGLESREQASFIEHEIETYLPQFRAKLGHLDDQVLYHNL